LATSSKRPPGRSTEAGGAVSRLRGALGGATPGDGARDHLTILSGTGQNIVGLAVFVGATFGANVLVSRVLGLGALGLVTVATQLAFIGGAATRFGMDMAAVRRVAIEVGAGAGGRSGGIVARAAAVAAIVSVVVGGVLFALAGPVAHVLSSEPGAEAAIRAAAAALPFVALTQVYLGGSRGLKIMRHTLFVQWAGQPILWIGLMLVGWLASRTSWMAVAAYAASWGISTVAAWALWRREARRFELRDVEPGEISQLVRYGAPRAPAALLSQAVFYTDLFVASHYVAKGYVTASQVGIYAASVRVAQVLVLFLSAVSYMFSPFVADLHARGERAKLDGLFKSLTRWTIAGTIPLLVLFVVLPVPVLKIFGANGTGGATPLRILLLGQMFNVSVGAVGFILIMVGRTGWDLCVYALSFVLDLVVAIVLVPHLGTEGAAIAQTTSLVLSNSLRLYLVWRFVGIQPYNRYYARLLLPAAVCLVVMIGVSSVLPSAKWLVELVVTGAAGGLACYVAVLLIGLTPTERGAVRRLLGRAPAAS
jgi:O-antigen/teichoic acid export membrane protein